MATQALIWLVFGSFLILSFILSGMEAGVFALSRLRIRQQMRAGLRSARKLYEYLENPENFLWTIVVGNTVANFLIFGSMVLFLHRWLHGHRVWMVVIFSVVVLLFYTFFDLLPKMLFRTYPNRLCLWVARPFGLIHQLLSPLVALVEAVSNAFLRWRGGKTFTWRLFGNREELRMMMQESGQTLSSEETTMINRVLDLQSATVRQAMKPLGLAATVTTQTPAREALTLSREHKVTRLPVWEQRGGQRRIVGLVSLNSLLYQADFDGSRPMSELVRPALYLDEDLRLEVALRRMQRSGQRMAIVLGRDRREIGILSLQDVLRVIFGEVSL
jgi:CBS domain containing-hemolysin-like protein